MRVGPDPLCESDMPAEMFNNLLPENPRKGGKSPNKGERKHTATSEQEYTTEELEFMFAYHEYKQNSGHKFPTLKETFQVFMKLGYAKAEQSQVA